MPSRHKSSASAPLQPIATRTSQHRSRHGRSGSRHRKGGRRAEAVQNEAADRAAGGSDELGTEVREGDRVGCAFVARQIVGIRLGCCSTKRVDHPEQQAGDDDLRETEAPGQSNRSKSQQACGPKDVDRHEHRPPVETVAQCAKRDAEQERRQRDIQQEEIHPGETGFRQPFGLAAGKTDEDQAEIGQRQIEYISHAGSVFSSMFSGQ